MNFKFSFVKLCKFFLCLPLIFITFAQCFGGSDSKDSWPEGYLSFVVPLTSPMSEWKPDDFGQETSLQDRQLLKRFQPRVYIHPESYPQIDFYKYYLPNSVVRGEKQNIVDSSPTRQTLKLIERNPKLYLDFEGEYAPCLGQQCKDYKTTLYGRTYHEVLKTPNGIKPPREINVSILKYSSVFAASGLPSGISGFKEWTSKVIGDPEVWHELDIHGAIHIILTDIQGEPTPFAVLLAQHNHFRTYIVGKDLLWPNNQPLSVCFAKRSNEPYLCPEGKSPVHLRSVGSPEQVRYLVLGGSPPLTGGKDVVVGSQGGAIEIKYDLEFLSDKDPLYTAWIPLGDKLKILGFWGGFWRSGPPGMDLNTWPQLKKYSDIAQLWYFSDGDEKFVDLVENHIQGFEKANLIPILKYSSQRFWQTYESVYDKIVSK